MSVRSGDRVSIVKRPVTDEDIDNQLYFEYFGGLRGTVMKINRDGSVCVNVDLDSLRPDFQKRHQELEKLERERWLNSLSEEAKRNMTGEQKQYKIDYTILVDPKDLVAE
ncbi:MAG: hypothetical protein IK083_01405 [Abditibacteriota bacterium]|nr:hypothetical protein [Abditibacteriota bacterium]